MFAAFHVTVNHNADFALGAEIQITVHTCGVGVLLWMAQEQVSLGLVRYFVHVPQHVRSNASAVRIHDEGGRDFDIGRPLQICQYFNQSVSFYKSYQCDRGLVQDP